MYVNPSFETDDDAAWNYVADRGFGSIVAIDDGVPVAAQVPLLVTVADGKRKVEFHVARPNPLHKVIQRSPKVLVVVSGPDAYISPDWYVAADQVPTWNYRAAHITGVALPMPHDKAHEHVERMSLFFEKRLAPKKPWSTSKMTEQRLAMMLRGIVPIEIDVERIEAATKLSQNKTVADRMEAARMLGAHGGWGESAVAEAMCQTLYAESPKTGPGQ